MTLGTEILVIGGGATGLGVAYDAALRGFKVLLIEKGDLANGTSGRYHGLLHSGGRYVISDPQSARDCAAENAILRRILPEAIEDCGGWFVTTPADPEDYAGRWAAACREIGVPAEEYPIAAALKDEALLNPQTSHVFQVLDAGCDSFDLCHGLARAAREHGAQIWTRRRVVKLLIDGNRVRGVQVENSATGEIETVLADLVLNCAGAWAGQMAALAGCDVWITPGKGIMIAMNSRLVNRAVNRLHPPNDGDILVPVGTVSIIGTTDTPILDPDRYEIEPWEVDLLLEQGEILIPRIREFRALRAWAGVRPLFDPALQHSRLPADFKLQSGVSMPAESRTITRAHAILDHSDRDGIDGLISVVGGKLTTFRLMAQEALDLACRKLNVERLCRTDREPISPPGRKFYHLGQRLESLKRQKGSEDSASSSFQPPPEYRATASESIICECELVTRSQIEAALAESGSLVLNDLRRDLRLGMGPCQGGFCIYRAAGILHQCREEDQRITNSALVEYLQERWKGIRPLMWGHSLRQLELDLRIYREILGADRLPLSRTPEVYPTERTA